MASVTPDGKHSKIVASLGGKPVTTARSDVDLVVTEYGVADLWGLDLHARAEALIAIAHPDFRDAARSASSTAAGPDELKSEDEHVRPADPGMAERAGSASCG